MMLAAIPGELIGLVIFAVAALLKWLGDRATQQEVTKTPPRSAGSRREENDDDAGKTSWEVDEERKRKFMEALGLPTGDEMPKRETPMVLRPDQDAKPPALPRPTATPPVPPFVYREERETRQKRTKQKHPMQPVPLTVVAEPPPVPVAVPILEVVPQGSGFELQRDFSSGERDIREVDARDSLTILREELGRPDSLRRAFLLREILGPPPGLQMPGSVPSFRSP